MYDTIARSYDELYGSEQMNKFGYIFSNYEFGKNQRVLDVGCGTGMITFEISKFVREVVGIDKSKEMIKIAKKSSNIRYIVADALNLPFKDKSFDLVISTTVMQDINKKDWSKFLKEIHRVTNSDAIVSILKFNKSLNDLKSLFSKFFEIEKVIEEEKDYIFFLRRRFDANL